MAKLSGILFSLMALSFGVLTGPALFSTPGQASQPAQARPNFIIILIDDLGWADIGVNGSRFYRTPRVDELAGNGALFTHAYAAAPVCSPTRASLLTGKYPARLDLTDWIPGRRHWTWSRLLAPQFQQQLPLREETIAEGLASAGYTSASIGKWHLGGSGYLPPAQGFDLNVGGTRRGSPPSYFCPYEIPGLESCASQEYLTDRLTDEAVRFIEQHQDQPFFLFLSHYAVHTPLQARADRVAWYESQIQPDAPQRHPVYAAMVESMDESVGRIVDTLKKLELTTRTTLFFTSDNGGLVYEGRQETPVTSNSPLRAGKGHLYEGGIRVPLIVQSSIIPEPGIISTEPVTSADIYPTILSMAGLAAREHIDGVNIAPLLQKQNTISRSSLFWHYPHYSNQGGEPGGVIREGDYKLLEFYRDGKLELYDLRRDPGERRDLAPEQPKRVDNLHQKLKRWRHEVGAKMPRENPDYNPQKADQGLTGTERQFPR